VATLKPDWKFSFSQLEKYSDCSEKYYWTTLAEERPPRYPAAWLVHGNAFHDATARWHEQGESRDLHDLYLESWDVEMEKQLEKAPDLSTWLLTPRVKSVEQDLKLRKATGEVQCNAYYQDYDKGLWEIVEVEEDLLVEIGFEVTLDMGGLVASNTIRGYVDQVRLYKATGDLVVTDLKTGAAKEGDKRQLGLYAMAVNKMYGTNIQWGQYWYSKLDSVPRSGDKLGRSSGMVDVTHFDEDYWKNQFKGLRLGIENNIFLPNPSDKCRTCDALALCSAKPY